MESENITFTEMIKKVALETGYTQSDIKTVMNAIEKVTIEEASKGNRVRFLKNMTLDTTVAPARTINPFNKGEIVIPEHRIVKVKAGKKIKDAIK